MAGTKTDDNDMHYYNNAPTPVLVLQCIRAEKAEQTYW